MTSQRVWMVTMGSVWIGIMASGCGSPPRQGAASMPAATTHVVGCGGTGKTWEDCARTAARECGSAGFDVLKRSGPDASAPSGPQDAVAADGFGQSADSSNERWMKVACHPR